MNSEYPYSIKIDLMKLLFSDENSKPMRAFALENSTSVKIDYHSYSTWYKTYSFKNRKDYLAFIMKFGQYEYKGDQNDSVR